MRLETPIESVKGVGNALTEKLATLNIVTVKDLIYYFPRRYEDYSQITPIINVTPGKLTVKGKIESIVGRYVRSRLHITEAVVDDGTSKLRVVWFNQPYRAKQFSPGQAYYFSGNYEFQRNRYVLSNPSSEKADSFAVSTARIVPIYSETAGLKSVTIRKIMKELLPLITMLPETLPAGLVKSEKLISVSETLKNLHFPESSKLLADAKQRVVFEELLWLMLASQLNKIDNSKNKGWKIKFNEMAAKEFVAGLDFKLTPGQKVAAWEIFKDFEGASPMNRLLQGDVGSGKTVVGAMAALMAVKNGYQVAFMAPTEILANQHANSLSDLLNPHGVQVGLLLGGTKATAKNLIKKQIAEGRVDVVVGTHSLLASDLKFKKLGLVVIDEQHRFGVDQRRALLKFGKYPPHLLSMTATPIPRSLQLTVYGELDVSVLKELPSGRLPIITQLVSPYERSNLYAKIDAEINLGRQVYIVCPLVADGADNELKSVELEHEKLDKTIFKHRRVGMLHGQLKSDEKDKVMTKFATGELDLLICTSVIEVGVDVPNASIMVIEGAERFGLAQLHQLRGRVGRGEHQSYCYVLPTDQQFVGKRLQELEKSNDGFLLAEIDLKLRGPGEVYGRVQHGKLDLNFASLSDTRMIKRAQDAALKLASAKLDLLQYPVLNENVNRYRRLTNLN